MNSNVTKISNCVTFYEMFKVMLPIVILTVHPVNLLPNLMSFFVFISVRIRQPNTKCPMVSTCCPRNLNYSTVTILQTMFAWLFRENRSWSNNPISAFNPVLFLCLTISTSLLLTAYLLSRCQLSPLDDESCCKSIICLN